MKANFWMLFFITLIIIVITGVFGGLASRVPNLAGLINLMAFVFQLFIGIGLIKISLKLCDGQPIEINDLFSGYRLFWKYLAVSILVGLIVLGGFILLIVPGIIWAIKYQFTQYLVVDKNMGVIEAIKRSGLMTKNEKWNLFLFGLLLGLINIAGAIVFGVGLFATIPTTMIAAAFVYRKLASAEGAMEVLSDKTPAPVA